MTHSTTAPAALLLLASLLVGAERLAAQPAFPTTPAGRTAEAFFAAYGDGSEEALKKFVGEHRTAEALQRRGVSDRVAQLVQIRSMLGELRPHSFKASSAEKLVVLSSSKPGRAWFELTFEVQAAPPHKLASFGLRPGEAPASERAEVAEWKDLDDLLRQVRERAGVPAIAVAVCDAAGKPKTAAVGVRVRDADDEVTARDRFHIGSVGKSITATLIGVLVERGELAFDAVLGELLPDVDMLPGYREVTLEQVLQHRAGLRGYLTTDEELSARLLRIEDRRHQRAEFVAGVLRDPPRSAPGAAFHYSNAGYSLLAHAVERRMDKPWEELVTELVLEPLAMRETGFGVPWSEARRDQPRGHFGVPPDHRVQAPGEDELEPFLAPAGDLHASVGDLARFGQLHLRGLRGEDGLLEAVTVQRLHTPLVPDADPVYAAGWMIERDPARGVDNHWHAGSAGAFFAWLELDLERGRVVAVAMNAGHPSCMAVARQITRALRE